MSLTLGLLSGASPAAALKFLSDVQAYTPAGADRGHLRVIADINPRAVGRDFPGLGASAGGALAEAAGALRGAGAEVLAIVSNSAHAWGDMIQRASGLPLVDMIQTAAAAAAGLGARRAGVLGSRGAMRVYREYLAAQALGMVTLPPERQEAFAAAFDRLRGGERTPEVGLRMAELAGELVEEGAEVVILGAVELALVVRGDDVMFPLLDAGELLARRCVSVCLGLEPAPAGLEN